MPVGGIREKVIAARRAGIKIVLLPKLNQNDLEDVPVYVRESLKFIFIEQIDEALEHALVSETKKQSLIVRQKKKHAPVAIAR